MSDFKDIAHKTVAELFDMLKEKQYTVDALSEISHEKDLEIADLKAQLNNMEACYIEKKKQVEAVSQVLCELKESMVDFQEMDLYDKGHRVTTEYVITDLEEALRGAND